MILGVNCASGADRSTKLAGLSQTAEKSSTWANRPPDRPRSNAPGGGLRKPSPQVEKQTPIVSVNPAEATQGRFPSREVPTDRNERNNPARFVRIFMRVLISSPAVGCKQISGTLQRRQRRTIQESFVLPISALQRNASTRLPPNTPGT